MRRGNSVERSVSDRGVNFSFTLPHT
jgi:hypothetical protein